MQNQEGQVFFFFFIEGGSIYTMVTKCVSFFKKFFFNDFFFFFFFSRPEIEEFWSIEIIKQYFTECVFVLAPWLV